MKVSTARTPELDRDSRYETEVTLLEHHGREIAGVAKSEARVEAGSLDDSYLIGPLSRARLNDLAHRVAAPGPITRAYRPRRGRPATTSFRLTRRPPTAAPSRRSACRRRLRTGRIRSEGEAFGGAGSDGLAKCAGGSGSGGSEVFGEADSGGLADCTGGSADASEE